MNTAIPLPANSTKLKAVWLEFPKSGLSGGWSRTAKHRPQPVRVEKIVKATEVVATTGKSVIIAGARKLKVNLFDAATGAVLRADYPLDDELTAFGLTSRQAGAAKAARTRAAKKAAAAAAQEMEKRREAHAVKLAAVNAGEAIAEWVAGGCQQPVTPAVLAAKQASGLSWSAFTAAAKGGAL